MATIQDILMKKEIKQHDKNLYLEHLRLFEKWLSYAEQSEMPRRY